jgi:hypothetical protein
MVGASQTVSRATTELGDGNLRPELAAGLNRLVALATYVHRVQDTPVDVREGIRDRASPSK